MTKYKQMPLGTKVMPGDRITISISVPQGGEIDWTPNHEDIRSIERPIPEVELPTVPGYYEAAEFPLVDGFYAYRLRNSGRWYNSIGGELTEEKMRSLMPLTRLVPETEVTPVKLADRLDVYKLADVMKREYHGSSECWNEDAAAIIAAIDNGELDK